MGDSANFFVAGQPRAATLEAHLHQGSPFAAMFERYWRATRRHLGVASAIIIGAMVIAVVVTLLSVPIYTSSARVEISREAAKITNVEGVQPERENQDLEFYQTEYALLTARSVAERVAGALNVVSNDRFFDALHVDIKQLISDQQAGGGVPVARFRLEKATDLLLDHVAIRPVPGSRLVDVAFSSPSAELSTQVANLWVDQFQAANVARRFESTSDARSFLEKQLDDMRRKLEDSQRRLVNYAAAHEIITLSSDRDEKGNTESSETLRSSDLKAFNESLATATAQRMAAQSQARQAGSPNQVALANIALNNMRERRAEVASDLARQRAIFEPDYPAVQALQAQVNELDRSIAAEESRIQRAAQSGYREAADRERALRDQVNLLKGATIDEQRASIQYAIYQREVDTNRELYESLLQRYKEIGVAGVGANNIAIVDHAIVPERPTSPSMPLNMALALLFGFVLAGGYIFVREEMDQSIKDPSQVTDLFNLALLGTIPQDDSGDIEDELRDSKSTTSEAYFSAASNMSFLTPSGAPRSFAVTSTRPNEGKSTSALALAIALARSGKRALLIDCDLRNPSQHGNFDIEREPGLSNLLSGGDVAELWNYCHDTDRPNLFFMPAGPLVPNPGALLVDDALLKVVRLASERFDHVIVDGPPMLGLADAPLISKAVDGVVYAIEANGVRTRAINTSLQRLRFTDANLFGAIVTKLNKANSAYGYGYGYGYGYSYGSKNEAVG